VSDEEQTEPDPSYFLERFVDLSMFAEDVWRATITDAHGAEVSYDIPQDLPFALGLRFTAAYEVWAKAQQAQIRAKHPTGAARRIADYDAAWAGVLPVLSELLMLRNPDASVDYLTNDVGHGTAASLAVAVSMRMDPANWLQKLGLLMEPDPKATADQDPKASSA
jgi:hypothetical protein